MDELRRLFLFNLDQYYRRRESINEEDPARTLRKGKQEGKIIVSRYIRICPIELHKVASAKKS